MANPFHSERSLSRRELAGLALVAPFLSSRSLAGWSAQASTADEPRFVDPPQALPDAMRQRLQELAGALREKRTTTDDVLSDPAWDAYRPHELFRGTIREHAPVGRSTFAPKGEPGVALLVRSRVIDREGRPIPDALVYAYHTSAKGWYAAEAPHVSGNSGDYRHARLFTYVRTDARGEFELVSVHPGGYPRSDLPCHIHLALSAEKDELVTEIRFAGDPRLTPAQREESVAAGYEIVEVERMDQGGERCSATFELGRG